MPQKQNPDALELIRGKCSSSIGRLTGFMTSVKGLPSGYNKDLQEDKSLIFTSFDDLHNALNLVHEIITTAIPSKTKMENALSPEMLATDIAYYLVRKG